MLGAVYNYDFSASSIDEKNNSDDYIAKIAAQNIQDKYSEHMSTAALSYVASNLRDEFEKNIGKNAFEKYSSLLTAIDATESIMRFIDSTDKALDIMDEGVLVNYMDQSAKKAYNVYIARRCSDSFDSASLNDLRLSAIMTLIASKKAYMGAAKSYIASANGLGVRVVMDYDPDTKTDTISFDTIYGIKELDENLLVDFS